MTRARMFSPGRWNEHGVAVPDHRIKRLPPCEPLPRLEQRPDLAMRVARALLVVGCGLYVAAFITFLVTLVR